MKRKHLAQAATAVMAAAATLGAHAQSSSGSSVTLYGLLDVSVPQYANHADANGRSVFGFGNNIGGNVGEPWFSGSRWGMRGGEDLGGGTKAIFTLESELVVATGAAEDGPSQLFDRDAWVGFQGAFGKVTFGFQNTIARDASSIYGDPYSEPYLRYAEGGWTNANNFKQLIFYAGTANGATRYTNSIAWKKLFDDGLYLSAGYAFGDQSSTTAPRSAAYQGAVGYNGGAFNVSGFVSHTNSSNSDLDRNFGNDAYSVGGNYTWGMLRTNLGYFHYAGEQPNAPKRVDSAWTLSFKLAPGAAFDYELGFQRMSTRNAIYNTDGDIPNANNDGSFDPGGALHNGRKDTVYASAFYHLSRRTEIYLAGDYMKLHGGYTVPTITEGSKNQFEITAGIRTRF